MGRGGDHNGAGIEFVYRALAGEFGTYCGLSVEHSAAAPNVCFPPISGRSLWEKRTQKLPVSYRPKSRHR